MGPDPEDFDCVKCGACCIYFAGKPQFIPIGKDDVNARKLLEKGYAYKRGSDEMFMRRKKMSTHRRCIALFGKRGGELKCSCYEDRPQTCRDFEAGGILCREARAAVYGFNRE